MARPAAPGTNPAAKPRTGDPSKGTGIIRGHIVLSNGRPARKASIQLASNGPPRATAADEDGAYEFTELAADTYYLSAGKPGYLVIEFGQTRAFERGEPIDLADGETRTKVDVTLTPSGAVSGRIVDENGEPVENVSIRLLQLEYSAERRLLIDVPQAGGRGTDDTGAYRIYGVPPGDYLVRASVTDRLPGPDTSNGSRLENPAADLPGYAPTYFPGTIDPIQGQIVSVGLSQDLQGIDFSLAASPTARLSGSAVDSRNQPIGVVLARSQRTHGYTDAPVRALASGDGEFHFDNLAPGEYVLQTTGARRGDSQESDFASTYVTIDGRNISDIRLQATSGSSLQGTVVFEGLAPGVKAPTVQITAWPLDFDRAPMSQTGIARVRVGDDGRFQLAGLHGPRRIRVYQAPPGWQLKTVRVNGSEVTDEPLSFGTARESLSGVQVVLTQQGPVLKGTVLDAQNRPASDFRAVAFSVDPDRWYQRSRFMTSAPGHADGTFSISSLAPGEYYVATVGFALGSPGGWGKWQDPDFLRTLSLAATKVTLTEGQTAAVALKLIEQ